MRAGDTLGGNYVLERVLGKGGMGVVWSAYARDVGQKVAVKLISNDDRSLSNELRRRLKLEAEACMRIDHPNVVRVYGYGETEQDEPYIVLELLNGEPLSDWLRQRRRLDPKRAARIAADVASGLAAVHATNVIHRDLKPANIFMHHVPGMPDGEFVTKVLDFGVCKDRDAEVNTCDQTKLPVGSPAYMSPEQITVDKKLDGRSDIYSLGLVLYEMLTGMRAFDAPQMDLFTLIFTMPVPAPSTKVRHLPRELDAVVARCTAKNREQRYATADELARELYAIADMPVPVRQSSTSRASVVSELEVGDMFDARDKGLPAAFEAEQRRTPHPLTGTIPMRRAPGLSALPPVDDEEDLARTVPMTPGMLLRRPLRPVVEERDALETQVMDPDAHIPSPDPDWKKAAAKLRESAVSPHVPPQVAGAANGETQMLVVPEVRPIQSTRRDATGTTTSAMSQAVGRGEPTAIVDLSAAKGARRGGGKRLVAVAVGSFFGLLMLVGVVVGLGKLDRGEASPEVSKIAPTNPVLVATEQLATQTVTLQPSALPVQAAAPASSAAVEDLQSAPVVPSATAAPSPPVVATARATEPGVTTTQTVATTKTVTRTKTGGGSKSAGTVKPKCTFVLRARKTPCDP